MRLLWLMLVVGCAAETPRDVGQSAGPGPEIDGEYLDATHGVCVGGVGGTTRCSGNYCVELGEQPCGAAVGCFMAYQDTAGARAFRQCLPVSLDAPLATGACATLDAESCATRQDCAGVYSGVSIFSSFVACERAFDPRRLQTRAAEPAGRQVE